VPHSSSCLHPWACLVRPSTRPPSSHTSTTLMSCVRVAVSSPRCVAYRLQALLRRGHPAALALGVAAVAPRLLCDDPSAGRSLAALGDDGTLPRITRGRSPRCPRRRSPTGAETQRVGALFIRAAAALACCATRLWSHRVPTRRRFPLFLIIARISMPHWRASAGPGAGLARTSVPLAQRTRGRAA